MFSLILLYSLNVNNASVYWCYVSIIFPLNHTHPFLCYTLDLSIILTQSYLEIECIFIAPKITVRKNLRHECGTDGVLRYTYVHTVVWECCKDERQSQWEMAKIDPQPTLNPLTDRHQIWNTWLRRGHLLPRKIRGQSAQGFLPPTYVKYTPKPFECLLLLFFRFFRAPTDERVEPIFALNTSYDVVLRKEVPFGGEKN